MPDIDFTLEELPDVDAVWVCGYERGAARLVRDLRDRHPSAVLIVTGRGASEAWADEALAAGADCASPWPLGIERLSRILHRRSMRHLA
jgi:hypothetical protein